MHGDGAETPCRRAAHFANYKPDDDNEGQDGSNPHVGTGQVLPSPICPPAMLIGAVLWCMQQHTVLTATKDLASKGLLGFDPVKCGQVASCS
jgi:hypothetical protein